MTTNLYEAPSLTPIACKSVGCTATAVHVVHWPGKTTLMCAECAQRAKRIAAALGLDVTVEPTSVDGVIRALNAQGAL